MLSLLIAYHKLYNLSSNFCVKVWVDGFDFEIFVKNFVEKYGSHHMYEPGAVLGRGDYAPLRIENVFNASPVSLSSIIRESPYVSRSFKKVE